MRTRNIIQLVLVILFLLLVFPILFFVPLLVLKFLLGLIGLELSELKTAAEIVNLLLVGVGAAAAGVTAVPTFIKLIQEERRKRKIETLRNRYPKKDFPEKIGFLNNSGTIYLLDKDAKVIFHLANPDTVRDLDFWSIAWAEAKEVSKQDLLDYTESAAIDTTVV